MTELKPCPFCGGEAELKLKEVQNVFSDIFFVGTVKCTDNACCANMGLRLAINGVINYQEKKNYLEECLKYRWNRRVKNEIN